MIVSVQLTSDVVKAKPRPSRPRP